MVTIHEEALLRTVPFFQGAWRHSFVARASHAASTATAVLMGRKGTLGPCPLLLPLAVKWYVIQLRTDSLPHSSPSPPAPPPRLDTAIAFTIVENGFPLIFSNGPMGLYLDVMENSWRMAYDAELQDRVHVNASASLLVGGEACAWGEKMDASNAMATIWPRAAALAGEGRRLWCRHWRRCTAELPWCLLSTMDGVLVLREPPA